LSVLQKIDEWLLSEVFEPVAWYIECHTSALHLTHVTLARGSYWIFTGLVAIPGLYIYSGIIGIVYVVGLIVASDFIIRPAWIRHGQRTFGTRNKLWDDVAKRLLCCILFVIVALVSQQMLHDVAHATRIFVFVSAVFFGVSFAYFLSCECMPPGYTEDERGLVPAST